MSEQLVNEVGLGRVMRAPRMAHVLRRLNGASSLNSTSLSAKTWKTRKASEARKSRADSRPAHGRRMKPVFSENGTVCDLYRNPLTLEVLIDRAHLWNAIARENALVEQPPQVASVE